MKVVTWNLGVSTGYRAQGTAARLVEIAPDLALLQEVSADVPNLTVFAPCTSATSWGSAIITKFPCEHVELGVAEELRPWLRIAAANVVIDGIDFLVASGHPHYEAVGPAANRQGEINRYALAHARWLWHCDLAFGILNDMLVAGSRFIVAGDWNTARSFQESSVPDAHVSEMFFDRARDEGWCEVGLDESGAERPTYRKGGGGHQLDHLFVDKRTFTQLREATIPLDVLDEGLSDHAPIIAVFDIRS